MRHVEMTRLFHLSQRDYSPSSPQRRSARNHDRSAIGRIGVPLGRELRVEIFAHVDRAGDRIAGKGAREDKGDRIARDCVRVLRSFT